jgi:hypothetical protein
VSMKQGTPSMYPSRASTVAPSVFSDMSGTLRAV